MKNKKIAFIGSGSWGTALGNILSKNYDVILFSRNIITCDEINLKNTNSNYLPGLQLSKKLKATTDLNKLKDIEVFFITVPTQEIRNILSHILQFIKPDSTLVLCSKGIEMNSKKLPLEIALTQSEKFSIAILSGPTFASEVARDLPSAFVIASESKDTSKQISTLFENTNLRPYLSTDTFGVQIGGALKNIIAIAAGIVEGLELGDNARASIITRGLNEIIKIGKVLGADSKTFYGLSGIGDLLLTCSSKKSRNFLFGYNIGKGHNPSKLMQNINTTAEGVFTVPVTIEIANEKNIELPIISSINDIIYNSKSVEATINNLLLRPIKFE